MVKPALAGLIVKVNDNHSHGVLLSELSRDLSEASNEAPDDLQMLLAEVKRLRQLDEATKRFWCSQHAADT